MNTKTTVPYTPSTQKDFRVISILSAYPTMAGTTKKHDISIEYSNFKGKFHLIVIMIWYQNGKEKEKERGELQNVDSGLTLGKFVTCK